MIYTPITDDRTPIDMTQNAAIEFLSSIDIELRSEIETFAESNHIYGIIENETDNFEIIYKAK